MKNCSPLGPLFICMSLRHFGFSQQHLLCSNCFSDAGQGSRMILSVTVGTSFHLTTCSQYYSPPPSLSLALFASLLAVRMLSLPTISALRCTQEEECCSAMRHMHIALSGMLHPQITHSVLGAKAETCNKTAILIASYSAYSLFQQTQTNETSHVRVQRTAGIRINSTWNIFLLKKQICE